jgi:hypothetical protein
MDDLPGSYGLRTSQIHREKSSKTCYIGLLNPKPQGATMTKSRKIKVTKRVIKAFDQCADLCSMASPNQYTDPKSAWARKRAYANMTNAQRTLFGSEALLILEALYKHVEEV